ncbi:hypothetical protein P171DRAFT_447328 [Karstenula rhodostoma CBS 690.94]|uniref:Uncharacterized protein n=1 Tax=Karstenula rhodostoma CBS 690.94 TaxID=1392251 RepID=A0A9P4PC87_9PLEO|nr:hypothetical protein P171DRAFT_447328 [Karstenula rhodostoma CBS 690.94]
MSALAANNEPSETASTIFHHHGQGKQNSQVGDGAQYNFSNHAASGSHQYSGVHQSWTGTANNGTGGPYYVAGTRSTSNVINISTWNNLFYIGNQLPRELVVPALSVRKSESPVIPPVGSVTFDPGNGSQDWALGRASRSEDVDRPSSVPTPNMHTTSDTIQCTTELFTSLGKTEHYLKPNKHYWRRLTLKSYFVYKDIYRSCSKVDARNGLEDGLVTFRTYRLHIPSQCDDDKLRKVWRSVSCNEHTPAEDIVHTRALVLAVTYMLHISRFSANLPDYDSRNTWTIEDRRLRRVELYDRWIPCHCGTECTRWWCFANDNGMSNPTAENPPKCPVVELLNGARDRSLDRYERMVEDMRTEWARPLIDS